MDSGRDASPRPGPSAAERDLGRELLQKNRRLKKLEQRVAAFQERGNIMEGKLKLLLLLTAFSTVLTGFLLAAMSDPEVQILGPLPFLAPSVGAAEAFKLLLTLLLMLLISSALSCSLPESIKSMYGYSGVTEAPKLNSAALEHFDSTAPAPLTNRRTSKRSMRSSGSFGDGGVGPLESLALDKWSDYYGVAWDTKEDCFTSTIILNETDVKLLGKFECEREAAKAYDEAALKQYGDLARLNFPRAK